MDHYWACLNFSDIICYEGALEITKFKVNIKVCNRYMESQHILSVKNHQCMIHSFGLRLSFNIAAKLLKHQIICTCTPVNDISEKKYHLGPRH